MRGLRDPFKEYRTTFSLVVPVIIVVMAFLSSPSPCGLTLRKPAS